MRTVRVFRKEDSLFEDWPDPEWVKVVIYGKCSHGRKWAAETWTFEEVVDGVPSEVLAAAVAQEVHVPECDEECGALSVNLH